eukprot:NODE_10968_length_319_cov_31.588889_g10055_i0.p3 GENE.NODE_10968_length_319_cov_31.588889_g10055_i0~~NODE_10968_length_319_cov_31.588889_g10055_i0.p3  ORF type:complete len:74 (+),score=11.44 NODE_10968_length_319_cov_31.588889_g10055_i0:31-252(+)
MGCFFSSENSVSLRMQSNPANAPQFKGISIQSAYTHYVLCCTLLLFVCVHFMVLCTRLFQFRLRSVFFLFSQG